MARGMQLKHDVEWGLEKSESRKVTRKKKGKTTMDSGYTAHKTGRLGKQWLRDKDNEWSRGNPNKDQPGQMRECNTEGRRNWSTQTRSEAARGNASSTKRKLRGERAKRMVDL